MQNSTDIGTSNRCATISGILSGCGFFQFVVHLQKFTRKWSFLWIMIKHQFHHLNAKTVEFLVKWVSTKNSIFIDNLRQLVSYIWTHITVLEAQFLDLELFL